MAQPARQRRRSIIESAIVALLVFALACFAYAYDGTPETDVELNDGGIWVSNPQEGLAAHLNYQARTLDGGLASASKSFDLSQEANNVALHDAQSSSIKTIDTSNVELSDPVATGLNVAHGENLVLLTYPKKKVAWGISYDSVGSFSDSLDPLLAKVQAFQAVVTPDDHGFIVDTSGKVWQIELPESAGAGQEDAGASQSNATVEEVGTFNVKPSKAAQFTAVGEQPILFQDGTLYTLNGNHSVKGASEEAAVQQPSRAGSQVVVATRTALMRIDIESGKTTSTAAKKEGTPVAPVVVNRCAYGAWAGSGSYVKICANDSLTESTTNKTIASMDSPQFRTSRSVVVINDTRGTVVLPNAGMAVVENWDLIKQQIKEKEKQNKEEQENNQQEVLEKQEPPVAVDDELGARIGATTKLPVAANDTDPNGDILTAVVQKAPQGVEVSPAEGGRALQITLPADQKEPVSFTYKAYDGQAYSANAATVKVIPRAAEENNAPYLNRAHPIQLAEGASMSYSVLPEWIDPEGDPIYLKAASADDSLTVNYRSDGFLSVQDNGTAGAGAREIKVTVSDGSADGSGVIPVRVASAKNNIAPVAYGDFYTVNAGENVELKPLENDYDPNGTPVKLSQVGDSATAVAKGEDISADYDHGTAIFSSDKAGSHLVNYSATDGIDTSQGTIRIDVIDPDQRGTQPNAQNDIVVLPASGSVSADVLSNDTDPAGKVIGIQKFEAEEDSTLSIEAKDHAKLVISSPVMMDAPEIFHYYISNGSETASAQVIVVPQEDHSSNKPPVAADDSAVVRAKDVVSVPVLANDYSPSNLELSLDSQISVRKGENVGEAFVSGNNLRFKANGEAGDAEIVYSVKDEAGNRSSGVATITVRDLKSGNAKPSPKPLEARAFAGQEVRIPVPLAGVDADGDSVELVQDSSRGPSLGAVEVEEGYLRYTAQNEATGTDSFTYKVKDRFNNTGEATVKVGIMPEPDLNQLPSAVPDEVTVKPDRRIDMMVTANDVDSDGDAITLVAGSIKAISEWQPDFTLQGNRVILTSPHKEGTYQFSYDITDGGGVSTTGFATLTVDKDAPIQAPVARDDRVKLADVMGRKEIEVPVLENDTDPDGAVEDLKIEAGDPARVEGSKVVVPVDGNYQVVLYSITDKDGLTSKAAIFVPGVDGVPPMLNPDKIPAKAKGGEALNIDVNDYVLVRDGHHPRLTSESTVQAANGGSTKLPNNGVNVRSDTQISFTPDEDFSGVTSVRFEVHDGESLEDPDGLRATLSLPVDVTPTVRTQPKVRPSEIGVAPGEDPVSADVLSMVSDPDEGDMERIRFKLLSASKNFNVDLRGSSLSVSTDASTPVGTTGIASIEVDDQSTDPVVMKVPLRVLVSQRPLMAIKTIKELDGRVGKTHTFNLLDAITNPFADKKGEITISDVKVVSGEGEAKVAGTTLSVTPAAIGEMQVSYTASDATKAKDRQVSGLVSLTVKDKPLAPTGLIAEASASRTVRVSFTQGDLQGGTLESFVVRWNGGEKDCGIQTDCTITGLENGTSYTFRAYTVTEVGESPASNSADARPDALPNAPTGLEATPGDGKVNLSWNSATSEGTPVRQYCVERTPGGARCGITGTSTEITGLTNGTSYTFRVQAINDYAKDDASLAVNFPWSAPVSTTPVGPPDAPGTPRIVAGGVENNGRLFTVSWDPPANDGGDTITGYTLNAQGCSAEIEPANPSLLRERKVRVPRGERCIFTVTATNSAGTGPSSSQSESAVGVGVPGNVRNVGLEPTGLNGQLKVTFTPGALNGATEDMIIYKWRRSGSGEGSALSGGNDGNIIDGFANGTPVRIDVQACANYGESVCSDWVASSEAVAPIGPPGQPYIEEPEYKRGTFSHIAAEIVWDEPDLNGAQESDIEYEVSVTRNGEDWNALGSKLHTSNGTRLYIPNKENMRKVTIDYLDPDDKVSITVTAKNKKYEAATSSNTLTFTVDPLVDPAALILPSRPSDVPRFIATRLPSSAHIEALHEAMR